MQLNDMPAQQQRATACPSFSRVDNCHWPCLIMKYTVNKNRYAVQSLAIHTFRVLGNGCPSPEFICKTLKRLFSRAFACVARVPECWEKYKIKTTLRMGFSSFFMACCR